MPGSSWAFTQAEIDQAALVARDIGIISTIADDIYLGRNNDTPASTAVQQVLIDELKQFTDGLNTAETGDDAYRQAFSTTATGTNLLAMIPGADPNEYVMIGAHYDHFAQDPNTLDIFNGATDDASGVAIVLAIGAAIDSLPSPPGRSVILALWDAEEDGLWGRSFLPARRWSPCPRSSPTSTSTSKGPICCPRSGTSASRSAPSRVARLCKAWSTTR